MNKAEMTSKVREAHDLVKRAQQLLGQTGIPYISQMAGKLLTEIEEITFPAEPGSREEQKAQGAWATGRGRFSEANGGYIRIGGGDRV